MEKEFRCIFNNHNCTIQELEEQINFKYLAHIDFETAGDRNDIRNRGMQKLRNNEISKPCQKLGMKYCPQIVESYIPAVSIRCLSKSVGYGLFAEEKISKGSYIGEYTGIVRKNNRRYFEPLNNYCYEYPVPDNIGRSHVIDATRGNLTRFINHSSHPNLKPMYAFLDGFYHLIFISIDAINPGTQLCYDYGQNYWYLRGQPTDIQCDYSALADKCIAEH